MIRSPAVLALLLLPFAASAEGDWRQAMEENPYLFNEELRMLFYDQPEILTSALDGARAAEMEDRLAAAWSPLQTEIETDLARIEANAARLFAVTAQGFGSGDGPAAITLFSRLGCTPCARAEDELQQMAARDSGLRVELRSTSTALPDRLAYVIARDTGPEAAAEFRRAVDAMPADTDALLDREMTRLGVEPARARAAADTPEVQAALADQADLFTGMGLDTAPSYVLPTMLIRGQMPGIVLQKYLAP